MLRTQQPGEVEPGSGEPVRVRRPAVGPYQAAVVGGENVSGLDDVAFDSAWYGDDLAQLTMTHDVAAHVDDKVDTGSDSGHDEAVADIFAGQQGEGAQLGDGLARGVGMDGAHARQATVERDQQVKAFLLAYLTDDDAVGGLSDSDRRRYVKRLEATAAEA